MGVDSHKSKRGAHSAPSQLAWQLQKVGIQFEIDFILGKNRHKIPIAFPGSKIGVLINEFKIDSDDSDDLNGWTFYTASTESIINGSAIDEIQNLLASRRHNLNGYRTIRAE